MKYRNIYHGRNQVEYPTPRNRGVSRGFWVGNPLAARSAVRINSCFPRYRGVFFQGANSLGCQAHASSFFPRQGFWRACPATRNGKGPVKNLQYRSAQSRSPPFPPQPPKQTHHKYPQFSQPQNLKTVTVTISTSPAPVIETYHRTAFGLAPQT